MLKGGFAEGTRGPAGSVTMFWAQRSLSVLFFKCVFIYDCTRSLLLLEFSLAVESRATLCCCCGLLTADGSPVEVRGFQDPGSIVVACGPSCPGHVGSSWSRDYPGVPCTQGRLSAPGPAGKPR